MRVKFAIAIAYSFIAVVTLFQPAQANAQKLVLYFPFEGNGDTVDDESGQNNHGKFDNSKAKRIGSNDKPFGKAMQFDKSRVIIKESKSLTDISKISFALWVNKSTETGGNGLLPCIISRAQDQHELAMDSSHIQKGIFAVYAREITGWNKGMPAKGKRGRGASGRTTVFGIFNRNGNV